MIKWAGYGKLLKQSFFTLLISCFILLGGSFVSALDLAYTYQNGSYNSIGNDFEVAVYNRGMLGTNYLGNTKRMIGLYSSSSSTTKYRKYFWWNNGYAYFYYYYSGGNTVGKVVGKFNRYLLCEPITRSVVGGTMTLSCGSFEDWGNGTFAEGFFSSITSSDYWGIYKGSSSSKDLRVCFSNSSYGKSLCFSNSDAGNYDTISMDSDISYIDFPNSLLGDPPGRSTSGGGNGSGQVVPTSSSYVGYCPTINQLLSTYSSSYSVGLCYSSSLIYSGGSVVSTTPKSIFEVFGSGDVSAFRSYRTLYNQNCIVPNTVEHCQSVFNGLDYEYSIVSKIPDDVLTADLFQYCRLQLLYDDKNTSVCVGSGVYGGYTGWTLEDVEKDISTNSYSVIVPGSGSVYVNVFGGESIYTGDIITSLQDMYGKFMSFFTTQTSNIPGSLPRYIISFLLVIILFKLFKK